MKIKQYKTEQELFFDFCVQCNDFQGIFTKRNNDLIARYKWLKEYGVKSYGDIYDSLPGFFVDGIDIIGKNVIEAQLCKSKK